MVSPQGSQGLHPKTRLFLGFVLLVLIVGLISASGMLPSQTWSTGRLVFCTFLIGVLLSKLSVFKRMLSDFLSWREQDEHWYPRQVVFILCQVLFLCFVCQLHLGFWFQGIGGWTYENLSANRIESSPGELTGQEIPTWMSQGLIPENAKYLERAGYIRGVLHFVHFKDGTIVPANLDLLPFVFPQYIIRWRDKELVGKAVRHALSKKQSGQSFLLPLAVSYPEHAPHQKIVYPAQPPAEDAIGYSAWNVVVHHAGGGQIKIIDASNSKWIGWGEE